MYKKYKSGPEHNGIDSQHSVTAIHKILLRIQPQATQMSHQLVLEPNYDDTYLRGCKL